MGQFKAIHNQIPSSFVLITLGIRVSFPPLHHFGQRHTHAVHLLRFAFDSMAHKYYYNNRLFALLSNQTKEEEEGERGRQPPIEAANNEALVFSDTR